MLDEAASATDRLAGASEEQLREIVANAEEEATRLRESMGYMAKMSLAYDNLGWQPMGEDAASDGTGIKLGALKKAADLGQAMTTANPLVKRGVEVRTSYIWGSGVRLGGVERNMRSIRRTIATSEAQFELERTLASDGNLFFEVTTEGSGRYLRRVPLSEIDSAAADSEDRSVINYIKLRYTKWDRPNDTHGREVEEWVPTIELESPPVASINGVRVNRAKRIKHVAVNRMVGWWWGVPDLYSVTFWVSAYKKYLEQCSLLNEAHAMFAWKAVSSSRKGGERMATSMAQAPMTDPATGQPLNVGGTGIMGAGQDLAPLQHARSVDFDNGRPLAALVAAGLSIPLQVLTSDAGTGGSRASDDTLDEATKKTMEARQQFLDDNLADVAELLSMGDFDIDWPDVGEEPVHRVVQAMDMAGRTGMLYPEEWRQRLTRALRIETVQTEPPTEEELPLVVAPASTGNDSDGYSDAPAQAEPMSYGDHELRDEGTQAHTEET